DVRALVGEAGGDSQALASDLQSAADVLPKMGPLARWWPAPAAAFRQPIVIAKRRTRGRRQISPAEVFAAGFDAGDSDLRAVLERAGLSRSRVLRWLCGCRQDHVPGAAPEGDSLELVMLNDDYTTMETVVRILETVFAFDGPRSYRTMLA